MKNLKTIALVLAISFGMTVATAQNKKINVEKSTINWLGKKVTGQHNGTINFESGTLVFEKNALKGGSFTVDMKSIAVSDLEAGKGKEKLEGHLKSDDFFGVEKHATSTLDFKKIASKGNGVYTITADLTIKDITNPVTFDLTVKGNTASTKLIIDRSKFDVRYGSGSFFDNLGNKTIYDDFELDINLVM
jgi:polyisoprenoid-binding protein YceI